MLTPPAAGAKRVFERLQALYEIGDGVGANRPGYSAEEQAAHDVAANWMREAGLETEIDSGGNLLGRLPGARPELPEVWTGSHLDSVPSGGRFDGALGVVAGLEALERVAAAGRPERTLAVAVFRAEETGCHGSRARCASGSLPSDYVEVHVEQGPVLAAAGAPLGLVTGITGLVRAERVFAGRADHAGTTPMDSRHDALADAARYILRVEQAAQVIEDAVATVGELSLEPGAANVVPARVTLTVDARAPDAARLDELIRALELDPYYRVEPAPMADGPRLALRQELERLDLPIVELPSGAGHDAGILAAAGVDSAMLFVRSLAGGASHSPEEDSSEEDVALAIEVLAGALRRLAGRTGPAPTES